MVLAGDTAWNDDGTLLSIYKTNRVTEIFEPSESNLEIERIHISTSEPDEDYRDHKFYKFWSIPKKDFIKNTDILPDIMFAVTMDCELFDYLKFFIRGTDSK